MFLNLLVYFALRLFSQDDDDDYQERYQTFIKILTFVLGKRLSYLLVFLVGLPFGLVYVILSSVMRIFHVVVRVKPLDDDGDGTSLSPSVRSLICPVLFCLIVCVFDGDCSGDAL